MENRSVLNWRTWSVVRRAQIIAAAIGFLTTIGVYQLIRVFCHGESMICFLLIVPGRLIFYPSAEFAELCGWTWKVAGVYGATPLMVLTMITFNTTVMAIAGTFVGLLLKYTNRPNR